MWTSSENKKKHLKRNHHPQNQPKLSTFEICAITSPHLLTQITKVKFLLYQFPLPSTCSIIQERITPAKTLSLANNSSRNQWKSPTLPLSEDHLSTLLQEKQVSCGLECMVKLRAFYPWFSEIVLKAFLFHCIQMWLDQTLRCESGGILVCLEMRKNLTVSNLTCYYWRKDFFLVGIRVNFLNTWRHVRKALRTRFGYGRIFVRCWYSCILV